MSSMNWSQLSRFWKKLPFTSSTPEEGSVATSVASPDHTQLTQRLISLWQQLYPHQDLLASLSDGRWYRVRMIEKYGQQALELRLGQEPYVKASDTDFTSVAQLDALAHAVCTVQDQSYLLEEVMVADLMQQLQTVLGPARYAYQHDILAKPGMYYRRQFSGSDMALQLALHHLAPVLTRS